MPMRKIFYALLLITVTTGCKKETSTPNLAATINILSPLTIDIYPNGTPLDVTGNMEDNNDIVQARVEIRNKTSGAIYYQQSTSVSNLSQYNFSWTWNVTGITGVTTATVKVICKDKQGNEEFEEVDCTLEN